MWFLENHVGFVLVGLGYFRVAEFLGGLVSWHAKPWVGALKVRYTGQELHVLLPNDVDAGLRG